MPFSRVRFLNFQPSWWLNIPSTPLQKTNASSSVDSNNCPPGPRHEQIAALARYSNHGNRYDQPDRKPWRYPAPRRSIRLLAPQGAKIVWQSNLRRHRYLKYGTILRAAQGLMEVLIARQDNFEVIFDIIEDGIGRVGRGSIRRTD